MIVTAGVTPTPVAVVSPNDLIFNTGNTTAYVDTIQANVIQAPLSSAIPVRPGATVQWAGAQGLLYARDPTGGNPGVGVTRSTGLPFPASAFFTAGNTLEITPQGEFLYNGPPFKGALVAAFTPSGAGTDFAGNVFPQGFTFGMWSASTGLLGQHFSIDDSGNIFLANAAGSVTFEGRSVDGTLFFFNTFGAVVLCIDPAIGGLFFYQDLGSATQGSCIGANVWALATVNDPVTARAFAPGLTQLDPIAGGFLQVTPGNISIGNFAALANQGRIAGIGGAGAGRPFLALAAPSEFVHPADPHAIIMVEGTSPDETNGPQILMATVVGNAEGTPATSVFLEVQGAIGVNLSTDTFNRWQTDINGKQTWGTGAGAGDVTLFRGFAGELEVGGILRVDQFFQATNLAAGNGAFFASALGDTVSRIGISNTGVVLWGTGAAAGDTTLYRAGVGLLAADNIAKNVAGSAETWHAMTLLASWANTGAPAEAAQYRLEPDNSVWLVGDISGGTITSGTTIATLPAGYRSAHTVNAPLMIFAGATVAQTLSPSVSLDSSGNVIIHNVPTGTTRIGFTAKIKLDA